jgi:cob(I)alamin adenosyltransferase
VPEVDRHLNSTSGTSTRESVEKTPDPMRIYTKTGDSGETALFDGTRVSKADSRVEAYGAVDELNAWLGLVRAQAPDAELDQMLDAIQRDLFALGARLADPRHKIAERVEKATVGSKDVTRLEEWIDRLEAGLPQLRRFVLAGGVPAGAMLHLARAVSRRAERRIVALDLADEPALLQYMNRLSDLLFVMARAANHRAGARESEW